MKATSYMANVITGIKFPPHIFAAALKARHQSYSHFSSIEYKGGLPPSNPGMTFPQPHLPGKPATSATTAGGILHMATFHCHSDPQAALF